LRRSYGTRQRLRYGGRYRDLRRSYMKTVAGDEANAVKEVLWERRKSRSGGAVAWGVVGAGKPLSRLASLLREPPWPI